MPQMKNFHNLLLPLDAIVNANWTVKEFANSWTSFYKRTKIREGSQKFNVIEKRCAEPLRTRPVVFPRPAHDLFKIS